MRSELDYVKSDSAALEWAVGCALASIQERVKAMLNSNGKISRPVLVLEWLMCFGPLTRLWAIALSIILSRGATIGILIPTLFGTLGPIGLIAALHATLSKSRGTTWLPVALVVGYAAMIALQLVFTRRAQWFESDLQVFVLLSVLPLVGALHLTQLSRSSAVV
jgi:hypothetical protein